MKSGLAERRAGNITRELQYQKRRPPKLSSEGTGLFSWEGPNARHASH
jgi:hypothetical protein